jgi:hypothetical protein
VAAVELTVVFDPFEAERIRALLAEQGIDSFTKGTDLSAVSSLGGGGGGPVEIWVDETDLERAQAFLEAE